MEKIIITICCLSVLLIGMFIGVKTFIYASEDSCTSWMKQTNGCYWRVCVDDKGHRYCQEDCGKGITRVKCD